MHRLPQAPDYMRIDQFLRTSSIKNLLTILLNKNLVQMRRIVIIFLENRFECWTSLTKLLFTLVNNVDKTLSKFRELFLIMVLIHKVCTYQSNLKIIFTKIVSHFSVQSMSVFVNHFQLVVFCFTARQSNLFLNDNAIFFYIRGT